MSAEKPEVPKEPPRRYQFTLRGLMLLTTACCVVLSLMVWSPLALFLIVGLAPGLYGIVHGFRARRPLDALVGLLVILVLTALLFSPSIGAGSGSRTYVVTVVVVDVDTGQPIPSAEVHIDPRSDYDSDLEVQPARTGADGVINVSTRFRSARSYKTDFLGRSEKSGWIHFPSHVLEVDAEGYAAVRAPLAEYIGMESWDLYGPPLPEVIVKMERKPAENWPAAAETE